MLQTTCTSKIIMFIMQLKLIGDLISTLEVSGLKICTGLGIVLSIYELYKQSLLLYQ